VTARIVVLASGSGTLLQALLDAPPGQAATGGRVFEVIGLISDRPDAYALQRAAAAGISPAIIQPETFPDRESWNSAIAAHLQSLTPDWVVCAGFMRILGEPVLQAFASRIVNTHPALLPAFAGAHGVRDALAYGVRVTGCTVHLVDAGVDTGPILAQEALEVRDDDDEASLHERIKVVERRLLVDVVTDLCRFGCTVHGRRVTIP
jgi:phosphoribosylglycinamide formyltransferase 1